jgi:hypothetical protein
MDSLSNIWTRLPECSPSLLEQFKQENMECTSIVDTLSSLLNEHMADGKLEASEYEAISNRVYAEVIDIYSKWVSSRLKLPTKDTFRWFGKASHN